MIFKKKGLHSIYFLIVKNGKFRIEKQTKKSNRYLKNPILKNLPEENKYNGYDVKKYGQLKWFKVKVTKEDLEHICPTLFNF